MPFHCILPVKDQNTLYCVLIIIEPIYLIIKSIRNVISLFKKIPINL